MNAPLRIVILLGLVSLLAACGAGAPATSAPSGGGSSAPPATSAPAQPTEAPSQSGGPAPSAGMDVSTVNMCTLLTRAELADLAGGTPYEGAETSGQACIYTIDPGDGTAELYSIGVFAPNLIQVTIDYIRDYEQAEWIEGIGDVASLQPDEFDDGYNLNVLVEGTYGLTLSGPRPEVLQDAARVIVERLGE